MDKNFVTRLIDIWASAAYENKLVIFLGAGFSYNFGFPLWTKLVKDTAKQLLDKYPYEVDKNDELYYIVEQFSKNNKFFLQKDINLITSFLYMFYIRANKVYVKDDVNNNREVYFKSADRFSIYGDILKSDEYRTKVKSLLSKSLINSVKNISRAIITTNFDDIFFAYDLDWGRFNKSLDVINICDTDFDESIMDKNQIYIPIHGFIGGNGEYQTVDSFLNRSKVWNSLEFSDRQRNLNKIIKRLMRENCTFLFIGTPLNEIDVLSAFLNYSSNSHNSRLYHIVYDLENEKNNKETILQRNWNIIEREFRKEYLGFELISFKKIAQVLFERNLIDSVSDDNSSSIWSELFYWIEKELLSKREQDDKKNKKLELYNNEKDWLKLVKKIEKN